MDNESGQDNAKRRFAAITKRRQETKSALSAETIADDPMVNLPKRYVEWMILRATRAVWDELKEAGLTNLSEPALNKVLRGASSSTSRVFMGVCWGDKLAPV